MDHHLEQLLVGGAVRTLLAKGLCWDSSNQGLGTNKNGSPARTRLPGGIPDLGLARVEADMRVPRQCCPRMTGQQWKGSHQWQRAHHVL